MLEILKYNEIIRHKIFIIRIWYKIKSRLMFEFGNSRQQVWILMNRFWVNPYCQSHIQNSDLDLNLHLPLYSFD